MKQSAEEKAYFVDKKEKETFLKYASRPGAPAEEQRYYQAMADRIYVPSSPPKPRKDKRMYSSTEDDYR